MSGDSWDGGGYVPIGAYGLLSDCHSAALVSMDGSVDWCCFHRFDARPVFARILDAERGGWFRIAPTAPYRVTRRYLPNTNVLQTVFTTRQGVLELTDCLPLRDEAARKAADTHPYHQLLRVVRCRRGRVEVRVEFHPRFDYGLTVPRLELRGSDVAVVYGGADALVLQCGIPLSQTESCGCTGVGVLEAGEDRDVVVTYAAPHRLKVRRWRTADLRGRLDATTRYWEAWAGECSYEGPARDAVLRSALVLKALTHGPTGAIVAAPTTSLPEKVGGVRNWDYRYAWLRDAALNLRALFSLGYRDEAHHFMTWLMRTTAGRAEDLRILYGVGGERRVPELELSELDGYRSSAPVRVGNAASDQFQLDVYGYLLDTAWQYVRHTGRIEPSWWELLCGCVGEAAASWRRPDDGIWEVRGGRQHFVSSKVMAWVAADRAIRIARECDLPGDIASWRTLRTDIRRTVLRRGVDPVTGAFVQRFGSQDMDASALLIPLVGFLPADDPRVGATVDRVEKELSSDGLVHRYLTEDGLPGDEGAFLICSFWLVDVLAMRGERSRAEELFARLTGYANDLGLLAEEVDPKTGDQLGNFPQAFSHIGLVGAALNLAGAAKR